jgi:serralysin
MAALDTLPHTTSSYPGKILLDVTGFDEVNQSIAVQADGKILVAGFTFYGGIIETDYDYSIVRLNADGTLDHSYGTDGRTVINAEVAIDQGYTLAVQPDGKLLMLYTTYNGSSFDFQVTRFTAQGVLDLSFNGTGRADIPAGVNPGNTYISLNADGTILLTGTAAGSAVVVQLESDGSLDASFGNQGTATISSFSVDDAHATVMPGGKLLVGGTVFADDSYQYALALINADGSRDMQFGDAGQVVLGDATGLYSDSAVTVQADGKILIAGSGFSDFGLVGLNPDGSFDTTFSGDGRARIDVYGHDAAGSVTVLADGKILVGGESSLNNNQDYSVIRLNSDGSLDTSFASPNGKATIQGSALTDVLVGTAAAETLQGLAGNDVLEGGGGRDQLAGGRGADVFRFTSREDSFRTATTSASDHIQDFNAEEDRIDLSTLGFTGVGNGHNGTLLVQANIDSSFTYLKSLDADANGHRFELVLNGDYAGLLNSDNVLFETPQILGTSGKDVLNGSLADEILRGLAGNDHLYGSGGNDVLMGGGGRDVLTGGSGEDRFLFTAASDSYRTAQASHSDLIVDFERYEDRIDVSALGYTGFGDGTDHTLKISYSYIAGSGRTYLKDLTPDAQGHRFEIAFKGDLEYELTSSNVIFAKASLTSVANTTPEVPLVALGVVDTLHHDVG